MTSLNDSSGGEGPATNLTVRDVAGIKMPPDPSELPGAQKRVTFAEEEIHFPTDYYYASTDDELESTIDGSTTGDDESPGTGHHGNVESDDSGNDNDIDVQRRSFLSNPAMFFKSHEVARLNNDSPDFFLDKSYPESGEFNFVDISTIPPPILDDEEMTLSSIV